MELPRISSVRSVPQGSDVLTKHLRRIEELPPVDILSRHPPLHDTRTITSTHEAQGKLTGVVRR